MNSNNELGQILVGRGLVDETQLTAALDEEARTGTPLGRVLAARGLISENDLYEAQRELFSPDRAAVSVPDDAPVVALAPPPPPPVGEFTVEPVEETPFEEQYVEAEPLAVQEPTVEFDEVVSGDLEDPFGTDA
ncbi:MAG: hypothetical protein ACRDKZ_02990, partial [Actinomycetota bacterium]